MNYKQVVLTERGGPEVLQIKSEKLRAPKDKEVQIRILACGVGRTDIAMRYGYYPFAPRIPFVPGYEIVGKVEAVGSAIRQFKVGERVAALTVHGGYAEYIYLEPQHLVKVPQTLAADEAAALILNYITAYQILIRKAEVHAGQSVLITGASGGVGTAFLDLGKYLGLKMYATASKHKHATLEEYGAYPLDYKAPNWKEELRKKEPNGIDFVFDGIGGPYIKQTFHLLKKGGKLIAYGYPNFLGMLKGVLQSKLLHFSPNGKSAGFYGISGNYQQNPKPILEDMATLFQWLDQQKIQPNIHCRMPLLAAAKANQVLESGAVSGKIVLLAPELLSLGEVH